MSFLKPLQERFPIDFSEGFKKNFGVNIKISLDKKKRTLRTTIYKKATPVQLNSLIGYMEGAIPPFRYLNIKSGKEPVYDLQNYMEFLNFIRNVLKRKSVIRLKIIW